MNPQTLYKSPNALAQHYSHFRVGERLLLTGHSHQAWPDVGFEGQKQAWLDAAEHVDAKWGPAFVKAEEVQRHYARWMDDPDGDVALAQNTHELLVRLLSGLPLQKRPKIVTTDGEFHTARRLFDRLVETGVEVARVPVTNVDFIAPRVCEAIDDRTSLTMVSSVLFRDARIVPGLSQVAEVCQKHGTVFVVDTYHHLGVLPFSNQGLESAYLMAGGYKYLELGEGNCALRLPPDCNLRPLTTGWFTEFDALAQKQEGDLVSYGGGASRFAGATYDPTSHYRAAAVFQFFQEQGLTPELLREISQHQVRLLASEFDRLELPKSLIQRDTAIDLSKIGGFLVLQSPRAGDICQALRNAGVMTDYRGQGLRLGPAPYLSDKQLKMAIGILDEVCRQMIT